MNNSDYSIGLVKDGKEVNQDGFSTGLIKDGKEVNQFEEYGHIFTQALQHTGLDINNYIFIWGKLKENKQLSKDEGDIMYSLFYSSEKQSIIFRKEFYRLTNFDIDDILVLFGDKIIDLL